MHITKSNVFAKRVAPVDAELTSLQAQVDQLARSISDKKLANSKEKRITYHLKTAQDERRYNALIRRRDECVDKALTLTFDLSCYTWPELISLTVECDGVVWNDRQLELGAKELESYEGRYEDSYRDHMGWPLGASLGTSDFPGGGEGKYLGSASEAIFRVGRTGKRTFGALLRSLSRDLDESALTDEQWELLFDGEVSAGKVYHSFPEVVRTKIQAALAPEKVLGCYEYLVILTDKGCFVIKKCDFNIALSLTSITQMSPKYRVKREYLEARLARFLVPKKEPEVAS